VLISEFAYATIGIDKALKLSSPEEERPESKYCASRQRTDW
jgi:hypothetical protein